MYNSGPAEPREVVRFVAGVLRAPGEAPTKLRKAWPAPPKGKEDFLRFLERAGIGKALMRGVRALADKDEAELLEGDDMAVFEAIRASLEKGVPKPKRVKPLPGFKSSRALAAERAAAAEAKAAEARRKPLPPISKADLAKPLDFADLDVDGDGKVSKEEVEAYNEVVVKPALQAAGESIEESAADGAVEAESAGGGEAGAVGGAAGEQEAAGAASAAAEAASEASAPVTGAEDAQPAAEAAMVGGDDDDGGDTAPAEPGDAAEAAVEEDGEEVVVAASGEAAAKPAAEGDAEVEAAADGEAAEADAEGGVAAAPEPAAATAEADPPEAAS